MNRRTIVVISQDAALSSIVERTLKARYSVLLFRNIHSAIDYIYNSIPNLVVVDVNKEDHLTVDVLNDLKADPIFRQLPVLIMLDDNQEIPEWESLFVEDYLKKSAFEKEGASRVDLSILRSERAVEVNPLTKLPGNISINREIQARIEAHESFALAYADLDHFKPFNDYYGFTRGDEVIRITGRLILNIVKNKQQQQSFIGHIGGDDFVFIMNVALVEDVAREIIDAFDKILPTLYDPEDRERGHIETPDRQGNVRKFPMVAISIGITTNDGRTFTHYGEITQVASEMKSHAKHAAGSCYSIDRRQASL
ncbi:MAG TPA: diguanylate cyclase [Syntrophorhabdaceae bacterium]|nr:diguanylate cyclase [Syntrophorhabdaceae bacterium]